VAWQERDYAQWTDEERAAYFGSLTPPTWRSRRRDVTVLAAVVSLVLTISAWHAGMLSFGTPQREAAPAGLTAKIVYGSGRTHTADGANNLTCVAMSRSGGGARTCTHWRVLLASDMAAPAAPLPKHAACASIMVDQKAGRWVCAP
jgi:hypothetical protein